MSECNAVAKACKGEFHCRLHSLALPGNALTDELIGSLAIGLSKGGSLIALDLSMNKVITRPSPPQGTCMEHNNDLCSGQCGGHHHALGLLLAATAIAFYVMPA